MKKLTAERCKRQIEEWQRMMRVSDVAVMVELNLQAYLIALPILEQQEHQERGEQVDIISTPEHVLNEKWNAHFGLNQQHTANLEANEGAWVDWCGGECPVADHVKVEYQIRAGVKWADQAKRLEWQHEGARHDIIAYRVIENDGREG